jgi:hypothetical protein
MVYDVEIWARNVKKVENRKQKGMNSWKEEEEFYTFEESACSIFLYIFLIFLRVHEYIFIHIL